MSEELQNIYVERMVDNLTVLRAKLGVTQSELAEIAGISRQTILAIEKKQRSMTWNMFLALLFIFTVNEKTAPLIDIFEIRDEQLLRLMYKK